MKIIILFPWKVTFINQSRQFIIILLSQIKIIGKNNYPFLMDGHKCLPKSI